MTPVTEAIPAIKLTERINRIEPSATMAVVAEADKLRQQGIDVVDFGAGEPHFSTPQHIKDAAIAAIQTIHKMEVQYQSQYGRYAVSLTELGPPASGAPSPAAADLIGNDLSNGTNKGYKFTLTGTPGG